MIRMINKTEKEKKKMTEREKLALLEDLFELEEGDLTPDMELAEIDEYDSMSKLALIVLMDEEFGVKLDGATIKGFETIADILAKMN